MICPICEKNKLFGKNILNGRICKKCYKLYNFLEVPSVDDIRYIQIIQREMEKTSKYGSLAIDETNRLISINNINFPADLLSQYSLDFIIKVKSDGNPVCSNDKRHIIGDAVFNCKFKNIKIRSIIKANIPTLFFYTDVSHITWNTPEKFNYIKANLDRMIENINIERRNTFQSIKSQEPIKETPDLLQAARAAFFLVGDYTKEDLKHQRNLLMKSFHSDNATGDNEIAQQINLYYEILLKELEK